jgi:membrane-associated protease RseP (regulator of RpoE activity)
MSNQEDIMFPLRFSPVVAALVLVVGLGAAVFVTSPAPAGQSSAWIGVWMQSLDDNLREAMNIDRHVNGALVSAVIDGSPAEKAGIEDGDIIVEVAGRRTTNLDEVKSAVRELEPGEKVLIVVSRGGQTRGLDVVPSSRSEPMHWTSEGGKSDRKVRKFVFKSDKDKAELEKELQELAEHGQLTEEHARKIEEKARKMEQYFQHDAEGDRDRQIRFFRGDRGNGGYLGVQSMEVGQLADHFGAPEDAGVLITEVVKESPAAEAGLKAGDVILSVGDDEVSDPEELRAAVRGQKPGEAVKIEILRRGERSSVTAKLGDASDMGDAEMYFMSPEDGHLMIPEIPRMPKAPRIDIQAPNFQWRGDGDAHVLRLDEEELQKFKEELHKSLEDMRQQLDEMKRELKRAHEDKDTD